jgi:hypothetical protein
MTAASVYSGPQWQHFAIYDIDETYTFVRRAFFDVKARFSEHVVSWRSRPASTTSA